MEQYVYTNKLYIHGKINEVIQKLKELSSQFNTVKELCDHYMDAKP